MFKIVGRKDAEAPQQTYSETFAWDGFSEELRPRVEKAISTLSGHIERLGNKYKEMVERSKQYFERCVEALQAKDEERAKIYASEIAEIRKLAGIVLHSQLVLLQVKIRLESILELGEAMTLIQPLNSLLQNVMSEIAYIAPEAAEHLHNLMSMVNEFVTEANVYVEPGAPTVSEASDEARFILEEARRIVAEKVRQNFPEAPKLTDVEKAVLEYVVSQDADELDLDECASRLNLSPEEVSNALKTLHEKGLIQLEVAEAS